MPQNERRTGLSLRSLTLIQIVGWTLFILLFLVWSLYNNHANLLNVMENIARTHHEKDIAYRRWATMHGGVYVPVTSETPRNPYLLQTNVPERDIVTPSGRHLTLMNPSYITRQVYEILSREGMVKGRVTSLKPLRPENRPDEWEKKALEIIATGRSSFSEIARNQDGKEQFRLMTALFTEEGCLKCHGHQGYRKGEVRGGMSISLPVAPFRSAMTRHASLNFAGHFLLWLLGLCGIWFSMSGMRRSNLERDLALQELASSEEHFRSLYEDAPLSYQSLDQEGRLLDVNQTWLDALGYTKDEIIGRPVRDFIAPEFHELLRSNFVNFLQKGFVHGVEYDLLRKDGNRITVRVDGKLSRDPRSSSVRTHCILTDITKKKRADEALRLHQRILSATKDLMSLIGPGPNYTVLAANDAHTEIFGLTPDQIIGSPVSSLVGEKLFEREIRTPLDQAFAGRPSHFETSITLPGRKQVYLDVDFYPYADERQRIIGVVASLSDITNKKRMETELRQAQKMEAIGTLAGGIAHDFNNILSAVQGYTELSLLEAPKDSRIHANLSQVSKASRRAADLVKQILTFSRQTEGEKKPLLLQAILKEAIKLLRSSLPSTIMIRQDISSDCPPVLADVTQMHQVIMNLCTNSFQAMPTHGGRIEISLQPCTIDYDGGQLTAALKPGHYLRLTVADNGSGMDEQTMGRIFEPYFTTKEKGKGTGLGLALVHGIVHDHGGAIAVRSRPGVGTTFDVYLPVIDRKTTPEITPVLPDLDGAPGHLLLVDDEEAIADMVIQTMKKLGWQATGFTNSRQALAAFTATPDTFTLVLTDQTMPELTGMELIPQLRAIRSDIPVILATGDSENVNEEKARAAGASAYLTKPFTMEALAAAIRALLQEPAGGRTTAGPRHP